MKVFISSLITGMEAERAAARRAVVALGHEPLMAEDFGACATSPQIACLQGVRDADVVVLILGPRYGTKQDMGISATHEEYLEARGSKPIVAFVKEGEHDQDQEALIEDAGRWQGGLLWNPFATADELSDLVTGNLHRHELAHVAGPLDPRALATRALALLPARSHGYHNSDLALHLVIAAGPHGEVLRPAQLEADSLAAELQQQAMFGPLPIFDRRIGADGRLREDALVISQHREHREIAEVALWPCGDVRFRLPLSEGQGQGMPVVIEEDVASRMTAGLAYASWLLERIDPTHRVTHVAMAAALVGHGGMGWRTRAEHAASPNSGSFSVMGEDEREQPVTLSPPHRARAVLAMERERLVEDLVVLLRRRWKDLGR